MKKPLIIPTILVKSKSAYLNRIKTYERYFRLAQIDVLNNTFVKSKSYYCRQTTGKIKTPLFFEVHLMINNPQNFIKRWKSLPSIKRFYLHVETINPKTFSQVIKDLTKTKIKVGLAINPETPLNQIRPYQDKIDSLLILAVNPGKNGAPFITNTYRKIKKAKKMFPQLNIGIDGGVSDKNAHKLISAGADSLAIGSFFHNSDNLENYYQKLRIVK